MNKGSNKRGELLVWPRVGPIGDTRFSVSEFEAFMRESFGVRVDFVEDLERRDGGFDTVIRFDANGRDGSEIIFRMFCLREGIYPIAMINRTEYSSDSIRKFSK